MSTPRQTARPEDESDLDMGTKRSRQRAEERERRDPAYWKLIDDAIARAKGELPAQRTGWKLR